MQKAQSRLSKEGKFVRGMFYNGETYLILDNIRDEYEATKILMHETFERGFDAMSVQDQMKAFDAALDRNVAEMNKVYASAWRKVAANYADVNVNVPGWKSKLTQYLEENASARDQFAREVLAHIAEMRKSNPTAWQRFVRAVRDWINRTARAVGLDNVFSGEQFTDERIERMIDRALTEKTPEAFRDAFEKTERISSIIADYVKNDTVHDLTGYVVESPQDFAALLMPLRSPYVESFKAAYLDENGQIIDFRIMSVGTLNASLATFRELARNIPKHSNRVILSHNHPGGSSDPSNEDIHVTRQLIKVMEGAGVHVLDHIITNGDYMSLREAGLIKFSEPSKKKGRPRKMPLPVRDIPEMQTQADWEVVPRKKLGLVYSSDEMQEITRVLRQINEGMAHIIYLNTQNRLVAIERVPLPDFSATLTSPEGVTVPDAGVHLRARS